MALIPPSADNEEIRKAIMLIKNYSGHSLEFKRNKRMYSSGTFRLNTVWPSAYCKNCNSYFVWDTFASHSYYKLNHGYDEENYWRIVMPNGENKHVDEFPTCNHVKVFKALE